MKKYVILIIFVTLILVFVSAILPTPNPQYCTICDSIPYHAPCLVNLATGEMGELTVYEPHPFKVAELNDYQKSGTFCFLPVVGLIGYRDTANWETHIAIPTEENEYEEKYFCKSCRELLVNCINQGYVLVDLRKPQNPIIYAINEACQVSFRCYQICVVETKEEGKYEIIVTGMLY